MYKKEVTVINPMQLRIPSEMKERITKNAEKSFRTIHSEILFRLQIIDDMERKGELQLYK